MTPNRIVFRHPTWGDGTPVLIGQRGIFKTEDEDGADDWMIDTVTAVHPGEVSTYTFDLDLDLSACVAFMAILDEVDTGTVTTMWKWATTGIAEATARIGDIQRTRTGPDPVTALKLAVTSAAVAWLQTKHPPSPTDEGGS